MNGRKKILIVDDDPEITAALADHLQERGYQVLTAARGEQGIELAKESDPDLIVLDVGLPDTSGYEVCQILRNISSCRHTPIIMLTAHSEIQDEVEGLKSGADDYIPKPFKSARLLARIETLIGRNSRRLDANALTHLPGNVAIQDEIQSRIRSQGPYAVLYMDLNNFKAFNDHYGFVRGDEAIQLTADLIEQCFSEWTNGKTFLGHVGGDDFVGLVEAHDVEALCENILRRFDQSIPQLYEEADRARGKIVTIDRKGNKVDVPIMGLAIAVVTNKNKNFIHPGEIALIAGELKTLVKMEPRSSYLIDRRTY